MMEWKLAASLALACMATSARASECSSRPYVIFFLEENSAKIDAQASAVLQKALADLPACPNATVRVSGHNDIDEKTRVSQRRAQAVAAYLRKRGIDAEQIVSEAFGNDRNWIVNERGTKEVQNRRVEVLLVAK